MAQYKGPASESQRVMHLQKKRERHMEEMEFKKRKLTEDLKFDKMESKFSAHYDAVETNLKVIIKIEYSPFQNGYKILDAEPNLNL